MTALFFAPGPVKGMVMVAESMWREYRKRTLVAAKRITDVRDLHRAVAEGAPVRRLLDGGWEVDCKEGTMKAAWGAWLLRADDGRYWCCDDAYFQDSYALMPPAVKT